MSRELWIALIALLGVVAGQGVLIWKSLADRADKKREELWRNVRWAVEKATESDAVEANDVGLAVLERLQTDPSLTPADRRLIDAVIQSVFTEADMTYPEGVDDLDLVDEPVSLTTGREERDADETPAPGVHPDEP